MISMQPYQNPTYFLYLTVALLPIMIGLLRGKRYRLYETVISLAFLVLTFGGNVWIQGVSLIGYIIYEVALIFGYFHYRQY